MTLLITDLPTALLHDPSLGSGPHKTLPWFPPILYQELALMASGIFYGNPQKMKGAATLQAFFTQISSKQFWVNFGKGRAIFTQISSKHFWVKFRLSHLDSKAGSYGEGYPVPLEGLGTIVMGEFHLPRPPQPLALQLELVDIRPGTRLAMNHLL